MKAYLPILKKLLLYGLGILAVGYLFMKLKHEFTAEKFDIISSSIQKKENLILIIASVLLMPINWGFEALKWRRVVSCYYDLKFTSSFKSIFVGVFVGNFTPNRIGEFAGRMLYLPFGDRGKSVYTHFVSGLAQFLLTAVLGCLAVFWLLGIHEVNFLEFKNAVMIGSSALAIGLLSLYAYTNTIVTKLENRFAFFAKLKEHLFIIPARIKVEAILFAIGRYTLFATQFVFLLWALGFEGSYPILMGKVAITFLLTTCIPTISATEIPVRTAISIFVFGGNLQAQVLVASLCIWTINVGFAILIGYLFILTDKLSFRAKPMDDK